MTASQGSHPGWGWGLGLYHPHSPNLPGLPSGQNHGRGGLLSSTLGLNPSSSLTACGSDTVWALFFSSGKRPVQIVPNLAGWDTQKELNRQEQLHIGWPGNPAAKEAEMPVFTTHFPRMAMPRDHDTFIPASPACGGPIPGLTCVLNLPELLA